MVINCSFVFVPNTHVTDFGSLIHEPITLTDVASGRAVGASVAQVGTHVLAVSQGHMWDLPVIADKPAGAVGVTLDFDYFELFTFGKNPRIRSQFVGEPADGEGEPLSVESVFDEIADLESSHIELICCLAGITQAGLWGLDWYTLEKRKGFLSRLFRKPKARDMIIDPRTPFI